MQKILSLSVAGTALIAAGCTTAAMANDDVNVRGNIEISGQSVIIHGVNAEAGDGVIIVTGDAIRTTADGRVIISGDQVDILPARNGHRTIVRFSDDEHAMRLAEAAAGLERLEGLQIELDEIHNGEMERALERVEAELERLHGERRVIVNGERREMTGEEREQVRRELAEARDDIARSMHEVRIELQEAESGRRDALHAMRAELGQAEREMAEAGREARRVHVIARPNQDMNEEMIRALRENGGYELRFVSEDGEERIWVDGEELEGEARTEWLNRLESGRLAGGPDSDRRRIVIEIDREESE